MFPSSDWTQSERHSLVCRIMAEMSKLADQKSSFSSKEMLDFTARIKLILTESREFLEDNREEILKGFKTITIKLGLMGRAIKIARQSRAMKQKDLAREIKTSPSYFSLIENGKTILPLDLLNAIAEALDVPAWVFVRFGCRGESYEDLELLTPPIH